MFDEYVKEFLPDNNETNDLLLENAGEKAVILPFRLTDGVNAVNCDDDDDEKSDDLLLLDDMPDSIPEMNEPSDTSDIDDDCLISPAVAMQTSRHNNPIEFESGHFKGDSSSDDDSISKGLNFQDHSLIDDSLVDNSSTFGRSYSCVLDDGSLLKIPAAGDSAIDGIAATSVRNAGLFSFPTFVTDLVGRGVQTIITKHIENTMAAATTQAQPTTNPQSGNNKQKSHKLYNHPESSDESEFEIIGHDEI